MELKVLMENIETLVIKRFKRVEKFIDYSFLHSEDGHDFIKFIKLQDFMYLLLFHLLLMIMKI